MRDLFIVIGFSAAMAVIMLSLIPAAIHRAAPKNAPPAAVLFAPGSFADVSFRYAGLIAPEKTAIR
jgi:hypothetical protein